MVGSWCLRSDVSECFCIELSVWAVARDEPPLVELEFEFKDDCEEDFRLASR